MKNAEKTTRNSNGETASKTKAAKPGQDQLFKFFEDGLKDIYWAEKALVKAIPKMIKNATASELKDGLTSHLEETKAQITRLEEVFSAADSKPVAKKCEAMAGLIKEAEEIMEACESGVMCDAGIIAAAQKVEHYEIASYGTLSAYAKILGLEKAAILLHETMEEEKAADENLTAITANVVELEMA